MHRRPLLQRLDPPSVAVFRVHDLGGMLCAVPALRALRAALPRAHVALIGRPEAQQFAQRFSNYVDEFIAFPGHPLLPGHPARHDAFDAFDAFNAFCARMRARRFALTLQLHGDGDAANDVVGAFGTHAMAGFCHGAAVVRDRTVLFPCPDTGAEPERLLWLMDRLGAPPTGTHLEFPLSQRDEDAWRDSGMDAALVSGNYICIHPGMRVHDVSLPASPLTAPLRAPLTAPFAAPGTTPLSAPDAASSDIRSSTRSGARFDERFAALFADVGDRLADEFGLQVVLTGDAHDAHPSTRPGAERNAHLTAAVAARMRHVPLDAGGLVSLGALAVLLRGARLLLCGDTDVSHIAAGLGLDSVALFSNADIARWAPHDRHRHRCLWDPAAERAHVVLHHARALLSGTVPSRQRSVGMWPYW